MTKEVNIKKSWSEITIKEYIIISNILSSEYLEEDQKIERLILTLTDLNQVELNQLKTTDYTKIVSALKFIKDLPKSKSIPNTLTIKDKKFVVDTKLSEIVTGQYLMLQNIMKGDTTFDDRLKQVLGIFIHPKDTKWGDFDFEENSEYLYNNLSIEFGYGLAVFFSSIANKLLKATQRYLTKEMKMMNKSNPKKLTPIASIQSGD